MKKSNKSIKAVFDLTIDILLDLRASFFLKKNVRKKHEKSKPLKIGFIVFEPETWDKLNPIYKRLCEMKNVDVKMIVVPSFDQELKLTTTYGKELEFFESIDSNLIKACDNKGNWIDISKEGYDYIFFQDPYNAHMPPGLKGRDVVKYSKICYIPYGYVGSEVFYENNTNKSFFRYVYCEFVDIEEIRKIIIEKFKRNVKKGYQKFVRLGYPALLEFADYKKNSSIKKILWTPRWSYDPVIGGSNFLEYKEGFVSLRSMFPEMNLCIRPHPMMFKNFINKGIITEKDKNGFVALSKENNIQISEGKALREDFYDTDILITDFSTIIPEFFMTGRPIIYCASNIKLNASYARIAQGMYVAKNWDEVECFLNRIISGDDYLSAKRQEIIKELYAENNGAADRIVNYILDDYNKTAF